jgi:hypothetical protein
MAANTRETGADRGGTAAKGKAAPKPTDQGPDGAANRSRKTGGGEVSGQGGIGYRYAKGDKNQSRKVGSGPVEGFDNRIGPGYNPPNSPAKVDKVKPGRSGEGSTLP